MAPQRTRVPARERESLETMEFARGSCLMREGSSGDACYVVTSGQVRIAVERPDTAGDGVVAHLGPGEVCGESSVLDNSSRSASAYANTDVVARRLSVPALRTLCERDPATGIAVLRWLSRHAAHKAREFSANLQEFLFTGEPDPEADAMVASAVAVQAGFVSRRRGHPSPRPPGWMSPVRSCSPSRRRSAPPPTAWPTASLVRSR